MSDETEVVQETPVEDEPQATEAAVDETPPVEAPTETTEGE
jgi:hypothetical protein